MAEYFGFFISQVFVNNILLSGFLGMCSFLACSRRMSTALGLGAAVIFVLTVTVPLNWLLKEFLLRQGALAWAGFADTDLSFLVLIVFISSIAALTQIVEIVVERCSPVLHESLGVFLPLIAVNCAILGASLFMDQRGYTFAQAAVYGTASGTGWALAIVLMAAIRKKLWYSDIPGPLKGLGITLLVTGLMSMAFMAFSGIRL